VLRDLTRLALEILCALWRLHRWRRLANPLLLLGGQREHALKALRGLLRRERRVHRGSGLGGQRPIKKGIQIRVECFLHISLDAAAQRSIPLRALERALIPVFRSILDHDSPPCPETTVQR
jgi:hypothetical protein